VSPTTLQRLRAMATRRAAAASTLLLLGLAALAIRAWLRPVHLPGGQRAGLRRLAARAKVVADHQVGWVQARRCREEELHELAFVVKPKNLDKLEATVLDLTDPASPNYRKWLSRGELRDLTRNEEGLSALKMVLSSHPDVQILSEAPSGELVRAHAPASTWERFLSTEFHVWHHEDSDVSIIRASEYFLPEALRAHVSGVLGATDFERMSVSRGPQVEGLTAEAADAHASVAPTFGYDSFRQMEEWTGPDTISPVKLRKIYNMPPVAARGSESAKQQANVSQVVFGTISQHWSPSDRTIFEEAFDIPQDSYVKQLHGHEEGFAMSGDEVCRRNPNTCLEANLDVQYMMAMAPWADTGYWYAKKGTATGMYEFLVDFSEQFVDAESAPDVISISYAVPENFVSASVLELFDQQAMKLAARGVTILAASGDSGADAASRGKGNLGCSHLRVPTYSLQVEWPASSRWVTAVGATVGSAVGEPDVTCSVNATGPSSKILITSGGGYSQRLQRPSWQDGHVSGQHRGVPDLSLAGHGYGMVVGGRWVRVDGTSASAPTLGGMVSLINAKLKAAGRPTVGFLNPLLYNRNASSAVFTDVTEGDNRCARHGASCCGGYDAAPGWDATTGLGVPDFEQLQAAILAAGA